MSAAAAMVLDGHEEKAAAMRTRMGLVPRRVAAIAEHPRWGRAMCLPLAQWRCTRCNGAGQVHARSGVEPCGCVLRAIFRRMLWKYEQVQMEPSYKPMRLGSVKRGRGVYWSRPESEFCADFVLLARRTLAPVDLGVFQMHFLEGADWQYCCPRLRIDRGTFFHRVYAVQEQMGRAARELEPYPLYPIGEYMQGAFTAPSAQVAAPVRSGSKWIGPAGVTHGRSSPWASGSAASVR